MVSQILTTFPTVASITQGSSYRASEGISERLALILCVISTLMMKHLELAEKDHIEEQRKQLDRHVATYNTHTKLALTTAGVFGRIADSALQMSLTEDWSRVFANTPISHIVEQVSGVNENNVKSEQVQSDTHEKMAKSHYDSASRKHQEFQSQIDQALRQQADSDQQEHAARQKIMS